MADTANATSSNNAARIAQFRKMANDDPNNELGHFSLGRALLEDGQYADAAKSFRRVIALNPNLSKTYQLLGQALLQLGDARRQEAMDTLTDGVRIAHSRGDLMPKN